MGRMVAKDGITNSGNVPPSSGDSEKHGNDCGKDKGRDAANDTRTPV